ncbi:hypothetical protein SO802_011129 [Lithocarpus litseifolius]|uniref:Uncharacterized protein n=1 Tax=Lithocarpus litseifolius TaxID=425828 RepID=A0AAW2DGN5_9ROSI
MEKDRDRSPDEVDSLARSNKKLKDHHSTLASTHSKSTSPTRGFRYYRDRLVGVIPRAFKQAFGLGQTRGKEAKSDVKEDNLCEGFAAVALS